MLGTVDVLSYLSGTLSLSYRRDTENSKDK